MTAPCLVAWPCHLAASLTLAVMGAAGQAETSASAHDNQTMATAVPPDRALPAGRQCGPPMIDFEEINQDLQLIIDEAVRSVPPITKEVARQLRTQETLASITRSAGLNGQNETARTEHVIAELRAQAERNLRGIVVLERALAGAASSAGPDHPAKDIAVAGADHVVEPARPSSGALSAVRTQLAESQTIRHALQLELSEAQDRIDRLHGRQAPGSDADDADTCAPASASARAQAGGARGSADQVAALQLDLARARSELADLIEARAHLNVDYQHCRYRAARGPQSAAAEDLQQAKHQISLLERTRGELQTQLSDAADVAGRCLARLARTDDRLAA